MNSSLLFNNASSFQNVTVAPRPGRPPLSIFLASLIFYGYSVSIPIMGVISAIFCFLILIVLVHPKLSGGIYKLMLFKNILELAIAVGYSLYPLIFCGCAAAKTLPAAVQRILNSPIVNACYIGAAFAEVALSVEGYLLMNNIDYNKCCAGKYSIKTTIVSITAAMILWVIPLAPAYYMYQVGSDYLVGFTAWGSSNTLFYYMIFYSSTSALTFIVILIFNCLIIDGYKKLLERKRVMKGKSGESTAKTKQDHKLVKMILVNSISFLLSRFIEAIRTGFEYSNRIMGTPVPDWVQVFKIVSLNTVLISISTNFFVYYFFNKKFQTVFVDYVTFMPIFGKTLSVKMRSSEVTKSMNFSNNATNAKTRTNVH